jgi:hypothetical protein
VAHIHLLVAVVNLQGNLDAMDANGCVSNLVVEAWSVHDRQPVGLESQREAVVVDVEENHIDPSSHDVRGDVQLLCNWHP